MKMRDVFKEDAVPANCISGGNIAGTGGENGEPGFKNKKKRKPLIVKRQDS